MLQTFKLVTVKLINVRVQSVWSEAKLYRACFKTLFYVARRDMFYLSTVLTFFLIHFVKPVIFISIFLQFNYLFLWKKYLFDTREGCSQRNILLKVENVKNKKYSETSSIGTIIKPFYSCIKKIKVIRKGN